MTTNKTRERPIGLDKHGKNLYRGSLCRFWRQGCEHQERIAKVKRNGYLEMDGSQHWWMKPEELEAI
jgi:hypothetical protein